MAANVDDTMTKMADQSKNVKSFPSLTHKQPKNIISRPSMYTIQNMDISEKSINIKLHISCLIVFNNCCLINILHSTR